MHRSKAMALIIVLIVAALLSMLMIAFMRVSHSNFGLARRSDASLRATQQCLTGLDYARNRMQHRRDWGLSALGARQQVVAEPFLRVYESGSSVANNLVEGEIDDRQHFKLHWLNNLDGPTTVNYPSFSRRKLDIPPRTALVVVDGYDDQTHRHLEVLLRTRFFSTSPLTSGSDLVMTTEAASLEHHLNFTNPTQENNAVRSRATTLMPKADQLTFGSTAKSGLVAGKSDVVLGADITIDHSTGKLQTFSNGQSMASASQSARASAESQSNASMQPGRDQQAPALDSSQLRQSGPSVSHLPSGRYAFTGPGEVAYYSSPTSSTPDKVYVGAIYDNGAKTGPKGSEAVVLDQFKFMPQGRLETNGDVSLSSERRWLVPQLSLGYGPDGSLARTVNSSSGWQVNGQITVEGNLAGNGELVAKGSNGSILVQGKTQMAQSPDSGLAVYADQGVRVNPPGDGLKSRSDIFDKNDFDFFSRVMKDDKYSFSGSPDIGYPQHADEWDSPFGAMDVVARQNLKVGKDEGQLSGGIGQSPVIRDLGLPMGEYERDILPKIPGWANGETPGGRPLRPEEIQAVNDFIKYCRDEPVTVPGITVGRHVRIKEFLRSCDMHSSGGDASWFNIADVTPDNPTNAKVGTIVRNLAESLFEEGEHHEPKLEVLGQIAADIYTNWGDKELPDISFRGLVYSGKNFYAAPSRSFKLRGTIASHDGASVLEGLHIGEFYFDQHQLYKLLDLTKIPLTPISWAID